MPNPNIVVLDTETTGLDCQVDRLVELAGVSHGRSPDIEFTQIINPERDIPAEVKAIHHILERDVFGMPTEKEAVRLFLDRFFLEGDTSLVFVAHNAKFDRGFIERIVPALSVFWVDTYKCAIMTWPDAPKHSNQVLRYWLGLEVQVPADLFPHRALYDCIVTRAILAELLKHNSLKQLIQWSAGPVLLPKVTFGKHMGQPWSEVPLGYLKWCVGQADMNEDVFHTANYWMRNR